MYPEITPQALIETKKSINHYPYDQENNYGAFWNWTKNITGIAPIEPEDVRQGTKIMGIIPNRL